MERKATKILFVAANPATTSRLALDEEVRTIENELRMATSRDAFHIRAIWAARPLDLLRELDREPPAIAHFSGHSEAAGIVLADEHKDQAILSGESLANLLATAPQAPRLVVLNACSTEKQSNALVSAVGCVIAMSAPLGDVYARRFSQTFYAALGEGQSVRRAFDQAVTLLEIQDQAGSTRDIEPADAADTANRIIPVLLHRPDIAPDEIRFAPGPDRHNQNSKRDYVQLVAFDAVAMTLTVGVLIAATAVAAINTEPVSETVPIGPPAMLGIPIFRVLSTSSKRDLVRINDVGVYQGKDPITFNVTMHNVGDRAASVTRLQLEITKINGLDVENNSTPSFYEGGRPASELEPTAEYHLVLYESVNEVNISHALAPDEIDQIKVLIDFTEYYQGCLITARLRLKYNATYFTEPYGIIFRVPELGSTKPSCRIEAEVIRGLLRAPFLTRP